MKVGKVWIHAIEDCGENEGGYYCMVYSDENLDHQIDDFCIHTEDCDCNNEDEVEKFIMWYAEQYQ